MGAHVATSVGDVPSPQQMLAAYHRIGQAARAATATAWYDPAARRPLGRGAGGDVTMVFDATLEQIAIDLLRPLGGMELRSEECGVRDLGGGPWRVLLDPLDGSTNAKTQLPLCGISIAAGRGECLGDVEVAYVADLMHEDTFWAIRGGGAFRNGVPLQTRPQWESGILGAEIRLRQLGALGALAPALAPTFTRVRCLGALALDLCHVASGAFLGVIDGLREGARVLDVAAAQLIVREAGGVMGLADREDFLDVPLGLQERRNFLAAVDEPTLRLLQGVRNPPR